MKKVVLLAPTPPPYGGIAVWTKRMMEAELKGDWKVIVVDEKIIGGRSVFGKESKKNIKTEFYRCIKIWKGLWKTLDDKEVLVVHSCIPSGVTSMMREYICAQITKLRKRKFIIHYRCTVPNTTKGRIGHVLLRMLSKKSNLIVALNQQTVDYMSSMTNTPICLIPNFVTLDENSQKVIVNKNVKRIIYVGGVIKEKGCLDIFKAATDFPNINFKLIGSADDEIKRIAADYKNVTIAGEMNQKEIRSELLAADIFIFLSRFSGEGFSNALAEAMAVGLPCIVTDWAANKDMIDNDGGVVVRVGNIADIVDAIKYLQSPKIREKCSKYNYNKVRRCYSSSVVLDLYVDAYNRVCGLNGENK